jgi:hypothetical protein
MGDDPQLCSRCRKPSDRLSPLPAFIRTLMLPASWAIPVFRSSTRYCPTCRRAMVTPTLVLVAIALLVLYAMVNSLVSKRDDREDGKTLGRPPAAGDDPRGP